MVIVCILTMALLSSEKQNDWHSFTAGFLLSGRDLCGHGHSHGGGRTWESFVGRLIQVYPGELQTASLLCKACKDTSISCKLNYMFVVL